MGRDDDCGDMEDGCCFQLRPTQDRAEKTVYENGELTNNNTQFLKPSDCCTFPKKARVDISFENVHYTVKEWTLRNPVPVAKNILKGVNGVFPSGELTAIMGPSGAGKSTLLNVLAAFTVRGASGRIMVNGIERDPMKFRKQSCYIQQDDFIREELTVYEAMRYASDLKLGNSVSALKKREQINEILEMLGLQFSLNTPSGGLSGGQRKRLSIALELISNPPVLFLDEPTTGLDSSSCTQCVALLKFLAQQGRTVVCTIHQPSSSVFNMFDNLYSLSEGNCIYSGKVTGLISYLGSFDLHCPRYHNPADFLLDVAIGEFGADLKKLTAAANGEIAKTLTRRKENEWNGENNNQCDEKEESVSFAKPASYLQQTRLLLARKCLMLYRRPANFLVRMAAHLAIGLVFGFLYRGTGENADTVLGNYVYLYGSNLFCVYTGKMSATLLFPMEMSVVTREHFNRWYKLGPYYLSVMIIEVPFQVVCCLLYSPLSYYLTGQPLIWERILIFCGSIILLSLVSQAMGFLIGILTPRKIAVFLGPVLACLLSVFGFCLRYVDTPDAFKWVYLVSYFRASFHVSVASVYGMNRGKLFCPPDRDYCPFQDPRRFLQEVDSNDVNMEMNCAFAIACFFAIHVATVATVWYRLNRK